MMKRRNDIKGLRAAAMNAGAGAVAILAVAMLAGCYIPGLGAFGTGSTMPSNADPGGVSDTFYGKFMIYEVGNGKIGKLGGGRIDYILGEIYYPTPDPKGKLNDYNILHTGKGVDNPSEAMHYIDDGVADSNPVMPSCRPEAINTPAGLALYYTNHTYGNYPVGSIEQSCSDFAWPYELPETVPPPVTERYPLVPRRYSHLLFNTDGVNPDVDVFTIYVNPVAGATCITPGTLLVFRLQFQVFNGTQSSVASPSGDVLRQPKMSLYHEDGSPVTAPNGKPIQSRNSNDYWRFQDAMLTYSFQDKTPATYFLKVEDIKNPPEPCTNVEKKDQYILHVESPTAFLNYLPNANRIIKGEIQPARSGNPSGNPYYIGSSSFEPDDLSTKILDLYPICNALPGVPGSGGAGDAGLSEQCDGTKEYGAHDKVLEYQEVDNKAAIDDGEYFVGKPTNLGTTMDAEASVIKTPLANTLTMFVNFGNRIYMLESLDGFVGLQWDLTNLIEDHPSVVPRQQSSIPRTGQLSVGSPLSPVVSSGALGFCETVPGGTDDVWATPEQKAFGERIIPIPGDGLTVATASGVAVKYPSGYPNTVGVSYGGNKHLDSVPLQDTYIIHADGTEGNTITSGPDGIVNTFFAPKYVAYGEVAGKISDFTSVKYHVTPDDKLGLHGPGNSDNPRLFDSDLGWRTPLSGSTGGDNRHAYLFYDDEWNPAIFVEGNTTTPPAYMARQHCDFYNFGTMFDRCAMGVPVDQNGEEPVAIAAGGDGVLNTVDNILFSSHGDDRLCHFRNVGHLGAGDSVAICPGADGKFGVPDIYSAIKGDDVLEVVQNPHVFVDAYDPLNNAYGEGITWNMFPAFEMLFSGTSTGGNLVIGIAPGPSGGRLLPDGRRVPFTELIDSYTVIDLLDNTAIIGGDHYCQTLDGRTAICPGLEMDISLHDYSPSYVGESRRLVSVWSMYMNTPETLTNPMSGASPGNYLYSWRQMKQDEYGVYDDNFCVVDGKPAICPGPNGYFQSYPISQRGVVAWNDDITALYQDIAFFVGQPCFLLVGEAVQKTPDADPTTRFFLYRYYGVRGDDQVSWDPAKGGYIVTTGPNGINQSCIVPGDASLIGFNRGLPYQPIITAGLNHVLETYPLKDYDIQVGANFHKISTGPDGIANSFIMGDDRAEIYFGTGKPDHPCVLAGLDGIAGTTAQDFRQDAATPLQANDTQLYDRGVITGFDSLQVWAPDAVVLGNLIYLYYTALGFETLPPSNRDSSGSLGDLGECKRAGLDKEWGKNTRDTKWAVISNSNFRYFPYSYNNYLVEEQFPRSLDNNEGVELAPRIGVAVSNIFRLREDPADWDFIDQPAFDVGSVCAGKFDFPIDLGDMLGNFGLLPDTNWEGAYSPDMLVAKAPDDDSPIFLMFFTGRASTEKEDSIAIPGTQIGLARSLDGLHFEFVRQAHPLIAKPELDLGFLLGSDIKYAYPTIASAGTDEWGEPMYGMFFNEYLDKELLGSALGPTITNFDMIKENHIGYAIRRGKITLGCNLGAPSGLGDHNHLRLPLQIGIIAVPLLLILSIRIFRRRTV
jgi:hypothetical protein